jgi:hypothetical protein
MRNVGKESQFRGKTGVNLSFKYEGQRFKSSVGLVLFQLTGYFLIFGFLGYILYFVLIDREAGPFEAANIAFGLVAAALLVFPRKVISVVVTGNEIAFLRYGNAYLVFPADQYAFGSYIVRRTFKSVPFFTSRYLRVFSGQSKFRDYPCYNFSKKTHRDFIAAVSELLKRRYAAHSQADNATLSADASRGGNGQAVSGAGNAVVFSSPYEALIPAMQKRSRQIIAGLLVSALALLVLYYFSVFRPANPDNANMLILTSAILLVGFVLIPAIWQRFNVSAYERKTPSVIAIENGMLRIDGTSFDLAQIQDLRITPPGYKASKSGSSIKRSMVIIYYGTKYEYWLGHTYNAPYMYKDYARLCTALEDALSASSGKFIYDI